MAGFSFHDISEIDKKNVCIWCCNRVLLIEMHVIYNFKVFIVCINQDSKCLYNTFLFFCLGNYGMLTILFSFATYFEVAAPIFMSFVATILEVHFCLFCKCYFDFQVSWYRSVMCGTMPQLSFQNSYLKNQNVRGSYGLHSWMYPQSILPPSLISVLSSSTSDGGCESVFSMPIYSFFFLLFLSQLSLCSFPCLLMQQNWIS